MHLAQYFDTYSRTVHFWLLLCVTKPCHFPCVEQIYSKRPDDGMEMALIYELGQEQKKSQHLCE